MNDPKQPWWAGFDMQGMLALAIIVLMGGSILMLIVLSRSGTPADQQIFSVLTTLLGVLAGSFKDVYGFFFGSSKGSQDQQSTITKMAVNASEPTPPVAPVAPLQTLTTPLPTTTGEQVTSVSGTTAPEVDAMIPKAPIPPKP